MTTTHIMLDIETWGKRPGCDIRSIGAVVFDPVLTWKGTNKPVIHDGSLGTIKPFYIATDNPQSYYHGSITDPYRPRYPLHRDPETVEWWSKQSPEAQAAFANPVDLRKACSMFTSWIINMYPVAPEEPSPDVMIWANDPHFDVSILDAVYHAVGLPVPWHYRAPRSFRTVTDLAGMKREEFSKYGDAHHALHDAIAQAMTVCEAYKRLGLTR